METKDKNQSLSFSELVLTSELVIQGVYLLNYFIPILEFLLQYSKFVAKQQQFYFCFIPFSGHCKTWAVLAVCPLGKKRTDKLNTSCNICIIPRRL